MKRHPALEPFSRDHNDGLILSRRLVRAEPGVVEQALADWDKELADHFDAEEVLLGPLSSPEDLDRMVREHADLRGRFLALDRVSVEDLEALGNLLEQHIRWEEREYFPRIELNLTEESAAALSEASLLLEKRRWEIDPHRADLVRRRLAAQGIHPADG